MNEKEPLYNVPGLRAGLEIVKALCESSVELGVAELAEKTGLNVHMVFRCIRTLVAEGWVAETETGPKYSLTLLPFHYVSQPLARVDIVAAAEEPLRELWKATGESVYLGVMHQERLMYLIHREGTKAVHLGGSIGEHYWPHASAPGKVLLAYGDDAQLARYLKEGLRALTPKTITNSRLLLKELDSVRKQGYAIDNEEYTTGGLCYAVPIFDYLGRMVATIGTTVLVIHYTLQRMIDELGPQIQETAKKISTILGGTPERKE